ncbi:helicase associated domain-containing protein [Streptomyces sp. NPDC093260]|uniref:helicase associated domain-containing protein n=1 Tax=Streptomyces sp. NPDC093260 TaxID=3155073 RepID=UPI003416FD40
MVWSKAGGKIPAAGEVIARGEELGAWAAAQRRQWDTLLPAQRWLLEKPLELERAAWNERSARRSQSAAWERNITVARQFHAREGHLRVPWKRVDQNDGEPVKLGSFIARRRAGKPQPGASGRSGRAQHALVGRRIPAEAERHIRPPLRHNHA